MKIKEFVEKVQTGEIDIIEHTHNVLEEAERCSCNYYTTITKELALRQAEKIAKDPKGKLAGVPISVKDSICIKDVETSAGSKILKGYKPVFNATVIDKVLNQNGIIIGKTIMDEFGFGSFCTNVGLSFKPPKNPLDQDKVTGGSSGGCAGITQYSKYPHLSIAESTGGSIATPAAFCSVYGYTPTYGLVSRYGLIDYASSLDKIGLMSKNFEDIEYALDLIAGYDPKDSTSLNRSLKEPKVRKVAIIKEMFDVDQSIKEPILKYLDSLNLEIEEVSMPITTKYALPAYYILAMTEASTNLAKFCGMRYGAQPDLAGKRYNEYFEDVRSSSFGPEAKRRIILGTFARMSGYRDAYYLKAAKIRRLIVDEYKHHFKSFDLLISPTTPILAPSFDDISSLKPLEQYMLDILTVGPNLSGLPHLAVPLDKTKISPSMMLISDHLNDYNLFEVIKDR